MKAHAELLQFIIDVAKQWADGAITEHDFLISVVNELRQNGRL